MRKISAAILTLMTILSVSSCSDAKRPEIEDTTEVTTEVTDEATAETSALSETSEPVETVITSESLGGYVSPYTDIINQEKERDPELRFGLVHVDDDDIPELSVCNVGYWLSLYTFRDGEIVQLMNSWAYGVMGNSGYTYAPRENIIFNSNSDFAGLVRYYTYYSLDEDQVLEPSAMGRLQFFEEGVEDPWKLDEYLDEPLYFLGSGKVSRQEFDDVFCHYDLRMLGGSLTAEEAIAMLNEGIIPEEHKYEIVDMDGTWSDAELKAREMGGHLVTVSDVDEYYTVRTNLEYYDAGHDHVFIIGGSLSDDGRNYVWSADGTNDPVTVEFWLKGEPSYTGKTEGGDTMAEDKLAMTYVKDDHTYVVMDVPDDLLAAAPSYKGKLSFVVEYE